MDILHTADVCDGMLRLENHKKMREFSLILLILSSGFFIVEINVIVIHTTAYDPVRIIVTENFPNVRSSCSPCNINCSD